MEPVTHVFTARLCGNDIKINKMLVPSKGTWIIELFQTESWL